VTFTDPRQCGVGRVRPLVSVDRGKHAVRCAKSIARTAAQGERISLRTRRGGYVRRPGAAGSRRPRNFHRRHRGEVDLRCHPSAAQWLLSSQKREGVYSSIKGERMARILGPVCWPAARGYETLLATSYTEKMQKIER